MIAEKLNQLWYGKHWLAWLLYPVSLIYAGITWLRRWFLERFRQTTFDVPVIVVGNLTVGGVGKTPLVMALVEHFQARGLKVGVVSRGYGAQLKTFPYQVKPEDTASLVGDEPLLLAQKTNVPVVIAPKRVEAVTDLMQHHEVDVVISDDGLQHYQMGRTIEVVVVDGKRYLGNGFCLPAGPMREPFHRIKTVDFVVMNGADWPEAYRMDLMPGAMYPETLPAKASIAAIAGIGHPERFFDTLTGLGIKHRPYAFPDHHPFTAIDLEVPEDVIVMTEKDAVKCRTFLNKPVYVLPVKAHISGDFWEKLDAHPCFQK